MIHSETAGTVYQEMYEKDARGTGSAYFSIGCEICRR